MGSEPGIARRCERDNHLEHTRLGAGSGRWTSSWRRVGPRRRSGSRSGSRRRRCCSCSAWGWCWTSSHIQERRTDRPPGLQALEVAHAASAHEDNVAAYGEARGVNGCIDGHRRRVEGTTHGDRCSTVPRRGINVVFRRSDILAKRIAGPYEGDCRAQLGSHAVRN